MAAATEPRKTVSIYDYPEHLNPFHEDDNHNKIRFWTIGKRLSRSNSISFSGLKDLKNSWAFRSFMKKGKKGQQAPSTYKSNNTLNGDSSPIMYRRALQYSAAARSTVGSPEKSDRYVYGGSITPLPRSRFQERLRSTSHYEVQSLSATPRLARSEVTGSRLSVESTNPFDEDPVPPVRASRRKKKRAPLPPGPVITSPETADTTVSSVTSDLQVSESEDSKLNNTNGDLDLEEDMHLNIELKIVEDEDDKEKRIKIEEAEQITHNNVNSNEEVQVAATTEQKVENVQNEVEKQTNGDDHSDDATLRNSTSEEDILNSSAFRKIDIVKYRRNSSVNEDDIRLRRGNLEDFQSLSNKRSKSLTNTSDTTFTTYDINLNESRTNLDTNGNEEPKKVVCKVYDENDRKKSIETISSTEKEFLEIDRATRELEREINKLNSALHEDDIPSVDCRLSVSEIKRRFDKNDVSSPNPIPKPRRSHYGGGSSTP
ncbi:uncharacterized protein LOC113497037 [Trichoplusia ni]|uniref:Uncharacterized protein LOC113497037 n=1 Tax=Trichoplusia ni TaxID=7111 RepID=A0A7E5VVA6_TRINI|nr:uncharacterized protein LOC113497037 [Trichoplusia ni]